MAASYIFSVVTTPDAEYAYRQPAKAIEKAGELFVKNGWMDDYFVTLTVEVRGREVDEDDMWLERRLGRE